MAHGFCPQIAKKILPGTGSLPDIPQGLPAREKCWVVWRRRKENRTGMVFTLNDGSKVMHNYTKIKIITYFAFALVSTIFVVISAISLCHKGNHISYNPWHIAPVYVLATVMALISLLAKSPSRGVAIAILIISVLGVIQLCAIDHFNILLQYEHWIRKGMPKKPF